MDKPEQVELRVVVEVSRDMKCPYCGSGVSEGLCRLFTVPVGMVARRCGDCRAYFAEPKVIFTTTGSTFRINQTKPEEGT